MSNGGSPKKDPEVHDIRQILLDDR